MAKITFGGVVTDARNKQGDIVFSRGRGGAYTRAWLKPHNPRSTLQTAQRDLVKAQDDYWQHSLTTSQREAWNAFADANPRSKAKIETGRRSGFGWFIFQATRAQKYFAYQVTDPPTNLDTYESNGIASFAVNTDNAEFLVAINTGPTGPDLCEVWATPRISPGITRIYRGLRYVGPINAGDPSPKNLWNEYTSRVGPLTPRSNVGLMVRGISATTLQEGYPWYAITTDAGTGDAMLQIKRILTAAELLALHTTPIVLVPAPGPNKMIQPLSASLAYHHGATPYTLNGATSLRIFLGNPLLEGFLNMHLPGCIDQPTDQWEDPLAPSANTGPDILANWVNQPLTVDIDVANLTLGDGTVTLTVDYVINQTA